MGTWEHRNIAGSPPPHNSLGSSAGGDPSKYKEKQKERFLRKNPNHLGSISKETNMVDQKNKKRL
jgi:hypothetical protein